MKILISSFIVLLLSSASACAQTYLFRMHRFKCSELYNVTLKKPKDFKVVDGMTPFRVNEKESVGSFYQLVLESKAKDCLILYPYFSMWKEHERATKNMVYEEVKAALGLCPEKKPIVRLPNGDFMIQGTKRAEPDNETVKLDTAKYIKMIAHVDMRNYFNADTVFIFKVPLPKPYKEIYSECIGVNVLKRGHPSAMIKILLTEEGKKREEEYLQILFSSIHYSDVAPEYTQEKIERTYKKLGFRSKFHRKKYFFS